MVRGLRVMIAVTGSVGSSGRRWRRRSPSVTMPASVPSSFTTMTLPKPLALISAIAACMRRADRDDRQALARMHDVAHELELRAELAARVEDAESPAP